VRSQRWILAAVLVCYGVLYARAAAYVQRKRRLDEAEGLLNRYLTMQTTPDDPSRLETAALLKSVRELRPKSRQTE